MIGTPTNTSPATPHASDKSTNQCASDKSTAQHASVKPTSTPQASGRKSPGKSEKSIGKGEHSGTGSTSKKRKRKKSSGTVAPAIPSHPSVIEAGAYTKRQEQVEEARAREAVYLIPREEMTVGEKGDTTSNAGSYVGTPGTEIVAFKREETRSTLSNARSSAGTQRTEMAGSNLGESGNTAPGAGSCASGSVIAGSASRASQVEESRDAAASHTRPSAGDSAVAGSVTRASKGEETRDTAAPNSRSSSGETAPKTGLSAGDSGLTGSVSRARRPWEWSAKDCDAVLVDVLSRARPEVDCSEGYQTEEEGGLVPSCNVGRGSAHRKRRVGSGGSEASNGKVDEGERKAHEVSMTLNRNNPRRKTSRNKKLDGASPSQTRINIAKVRPSSKTQETVDDEQEARNLSALLNRNMPRRGSKSPSDGVRSEGSGTISQGEDWRSSGGDIRCEVGNNSSGSPTPVRTSYILKGGKGNLCANKGTALGKGSAAEVLWDDRKWYRVTLSSISAEGTHGVLEFLPYRRRNHAREFSSQLELGDWVRAGKLVLPGTHLKWD